MAFFTNIPSKNSFKEHFFNVQFDGLSFNICSIVEAPSNSHKYLLCVAFKAIACLHNMLQELLHFFFY
ncbi:hypothetical protein Sjap_007903 [Stephania japonica]|uniref:Uncharacterized protein n=1 Tax=Stephania japonica TaxID=461633 RepID=A0AAP0JNW4_9MAGN